MNVPTALPRCAVPPAEVAALADTLVQHRRARTDQIEALLRNGADERTLAVARLHLRELDAALLRMHDQSYGWCVRCAQALPLELLYARPSAQLCSPCRAESLPGSAPC